MLNMFKKPMPSRAIQVDLPGVRNIPYDDIILPPKLEQLGSGSFGSVYQCKVKDQVCAYKKIKIQEDNKDLFVKEVKLLKSNC